MRNKRKVELIIEAKFGEVEKNVFQKFSTLEKRSFYNYFYHYNENISPTQYLRKKAEQTQLLSFEEIAKELNMTYRQVRKTYYCALNKLKSHPKLLELVND